MTQTNGPLVHFAGRSIRFATDHPGLLKAIETHFKHCLGGDGKPVAEYQISSGQDAAFDWDKFMRYERELKLERLANFTANLLHDIFLAEIPESVQRSRMVAMTFLKTGSWLDSSSPWEIPISEWSCFFSFLSPPSIC